MFLIENKISSELNNFLLEIGITNSDEKVIAIEKPGEGNMNLVLRIVTDKQRFILKQSRDFVQKYPEIEAPIERVFVEANFYNAISENEILKSKMPKILGFFPEHFLIVLEDLGANSDFTNLYKSDSQISENEVIELTKFLSELHKFEVRNYPSNEALKQLNHFHIFDFPFDKNNNFNLDEIQSGLSKICTLIQNNQDLKAKIKALGMVYLQTGNTLIHGDFYPGSWLKVGKKISIIDPEFSYLGMPEFDLAVFIAHFAIAQKSNLINIITANYKKTDTFDTQLMCGFVGIEILRRLLGVAQLPITLSLTEKEKLIEDAQSLILSGKKVEIVQIMKFEKI
jgi:5-methylthioribose kinase